MRRSSTSCLTSTNGLTSIYGCVEERMLYSSLIYFLWTPDVPVSCCKVIVNDSTDYGLGFQHTYIYIAVRNP